MSCVSAGVKSSEWQHPSDLTRRYIALSAVLYNYVEVSLSSNHLADLRNDAKQD